MGCLTGVGAGGPGSGSCSFLGRAWAVPVPEGGQEGLALGEHLGAQPGYCLSWPRASRVTGRGTHPSAPADGRPLCSLMFPVVP